MQGPGQDRVRHWTAARQGSLQVRGRSGLGASGWVGRAASSRMHLEMGFCTARASVLILAWVKDPVRGALEQGERGKEHERGKGKG